jgi:dTDP-4-dehydrorhamnose 3,5-epimerase
MRFRKTTIEGAVIVEPELERHADERGFFARTWCHAEFHAHGLSPGFLQASISYSPRRGTLRGLHYQVPPHEEAKLVRCTRGAIYDVAVDLRPQSPTFLRHAAAILNSENRLALYVPEGCAHGFLTLEDDTEVFYQMSAVHAPAFARGVRWNDALFAIDWPMAPSVISVRDQHYEDFAMQQRATSVTP